MDKIYIFMQCAPELHEYFQSICDLKAESCMESLCAQSSSRFCGYGYSTTCSTIPSYSLHSDASIVQVLHPILLRHR
eukprot:COSAG05_NODE_120_length_17734_cov_79.637823_9_plen_77_part_00